MERFRRATKSNDADQYVLTVFLPLLSVAILACIGGCCYMERRRRRRKKKNGGIDPEELRHRQDTNDDAVSVISTSSSKRRHYLDPTPTTGRMVRGARVRSSYSRFGEPLYDLEKRRRSSISSQSHPEWDRISSHLQERPSSRHGSGYGGRPLSRARSMTDIRASGEVDGKPLRRSRSSNSFGRMSSDVADSGYNENQSNSETENTYEFLNLKSEKEADNNPPPFRRSRPVSPAQSAYSVRTAPSWTGQDYHTNNRRSQSRQTSAHREFSAYHDRPMSRSMSQPDLSRLVDSKTYPQGILKKDNIGDGRSRRSTGSYNSYSGAQGETYTGSEYNGHYRHHSHSNRQQHANEVSNDQSNARASSRPSSALNYPAQSYDPYYTTRYGDYNVYGSYGHAPAYSTSGYHRQHQLPGNKYTGGYNQYGNYNDYWNNYSHNHRMSMY